jgi:hypothetical protein
LRADKETRLAGPSDSVVAKAIKGRWVMKAFVRVILAVGILAALSKGNFWLVGILVLIELSMMKAVLLAFVLLALGGQVFIRLLDSKAGFLDYAIAVALAVFVIYLHAARHRGWLLLRPWGEA